MDIRNRSLEALVLKAKDYREQDKLLTIVSAAHGPERVVARGARKPAGSLRSIAQPYSQVQLLLSPARAGLSFVQEGLPEQSFFSLDAGLERFSYAAYFSELLLLAWPEGRPSDTLYALILTAFTLLKLDDDYARTARFFELRLLQQMGQLPALDRCSSCGRALSSHHFMLLPEPGALLCANCAVGKQAPSLSPGAARSMERLLTLPLARIPSLQISPPLQAEMERSLAYYLDYHLDGAARARHLLQQLVR